MSDRKRQIDSLFDSEGPLQAGDIARSIGVTRQTAHRHLRQLVADGRLEVEGAGRSTRYRRPKNIDTRRYPTENLTEDHVWAEMSGTGSMVESLPDAARAVLHYALTEMVNNVVDHSGALEVELALFLEGGCAKLSVRDLGVGIFNHIRLKLDLQSEIEALQELSKGKTTTMPSRHTGEGIFFTSRAVNRFEIESGTLRWIVDNRRMDMAVGSLDPPARGTTVNLEIDQDSARDLTEVFEQHTEDFEFAKTRIVVRLFEIGTEFVSRSQAKRLTSGLEKFREVALDFAGVELVGQGFADEVFRVWAQFHPEVRLIPVDMIEPVAFMVERAIQGARQSEKNSP